MEAELALRVGQAGKLLHDLELAEAREEQNELLVASLKNRLAGAEREKKKREEEGEAQAQAFEVERSALYDAEQVRAEHCDFVLMPDASCILKLLKSRIITLTRRMDVPSNISGPSVEPADDVPVAEVEALRRQLQAERAEKDDLRRDMEALEVAHASLEKAASSQKAEIGALQQSNQDLKGVFLPCAASWRQADALIRGGGELDHDVDGEDAVGPDAGPQGSRPRPSQRQSPGPSRRGPGRTRSPLGP